MRDKDSHEGERNCHLCIHLPTESVEGGHVTALNSIAEIRFHHLTKFSSFDC
jgi:hypothetical protein